MRTSNATTVLSESAGGTERVAKAPSELMQTATQSSLATMFVPTCRHRRRQRCRTRPRRRHRRGRGRRHRRRHRRRRRRRRRRHRRRRRRHLRRRRRRRPRRRPHSRRRPPRLGTSAPTKACGWSAAIRDMPPKIASTEMRVHGLRFATRRLREETPRCKPTFAATRSLSSTSDASSKSTRSLSTSDAMRPTTGDATDSSRRNWATIKSGSATALSTPKTPPPARCATTT